MRDRQLECKLVVAAIDVGDRAVASFDVVGAGHAECSFGASAWGAPLATHRREIDQLIGLAVNYARDFVVPTLKRRAPSDAEAEALRNLDSELAALPDDADAEAIQNIVFEIGKGHYGKERLRDWFQALYETLLGSSQGPRMGSFIALYGIDNSRRLIADALGVAGR
jgi:lysyl-tRNA synthetase class I